MRIGSLSISNFRYCAEVERTGGGGSILHWIRHMRFANGMRSSRFWGQHIVLAHGRWSCSSQVTSRRRAFQLECNRDHLLTIDLWRSFARGFCKSIGPAYPLGRFSHGCRRAFGPWRNAHEHHCFFGCFGLPVRGWDMVLARPQVGFEGYAVTLPVHCRPAKLLQECA